MDWVHEEGFCDESARDKNWVDFFDLSGQADPEDLYRAQDAIAKFTATKTKLMAGNHERLLIAPVATTKDIVESEHLDA